MSCDLMCLSRDFGVIFRAACDDVNDIENAVQNVTVSKPVAVTMNKKRKIEKKEVSARF